MARSRLEEKRETIQAPGRKSLPRIEQGRSGVDQKANRNQLPDTDQDLQFTTTSNCKKGSTNIEHDDSRPSSPRPRNYDIEKSLEVLI